MHALVYPPQVSGGWTRPLVHGLGAALLAVTRSLAIFWPDRRA